MLGGGLGSCHGAAALLAQHGPSFSAGGSNVTNLVRTGAAHPSARESLHCALLCALPASSERLRRGMRDLAVS